MKSIVEPTARSLRANTTLTPALRSAPKRRVRIRSIMSKKKKNYEQINKKGDDFVQIGDRVKIGKYTGE